MTKQQQLKAVVRLAAFCRERNIVIRPIIENAPEMAQILQEEGMEISEDKMTEIETLKVLFELATWNPNSANSV